MSKFCGHLLDFEVKVKIDIFLHLDNIYYSFFCHLLVRKAIIEVFKRLRIISIYIYLLTRNISVSQVHHPKNLNEHPSKVLFAIHFIFSFLFVILVYHKFCLVRFHVL